MTDNGLGQKVTVHVGDCRCPGSPHASGDEVYLAPKLSATLGAAAMSAANTLENPEAPEVEAAISRVFLRQGIIGWNLVDAEGEPIEVTPAAAEERFGDWASGGFEIINAADGLYAEDLYAPLVAARRRRSSGDGPTETLTSPVSPSGSKPPKPSTSSSPAPTDGLLSEVLTG